MPKTTNINLELTTDNQTKFKDWRDIINGQGTGESGSPYSNAQLIDAAIGNLITNKQDKLTAGSGIVITNNVISASITGIKYLVVQELPLVGENGTIYLVPNNESGSELNVYDEYIYIVSESKWELIGSTQVDFSDYYNKSAVDALLALKQGLLIAGTNITIDPSTNTISAQAGSNVIANETLAGTEEALTELTVDGVKYKVVGVIDVDNQLSLVSENPVQNKVITTALNDKEDKVNTSVDQYTTSIDYTFVDNADKTYSHQIDNDIIVRIPSTITHGTMSVLNLTNVVAGTKITVLNSSSYPVRFINNNRLISAAYYEFGMTGRKIVFLRCDGQCAEVLLIEEIAY